MGPTGPMTMLLRLTLLTTESDIKERLSLLRRRAQLMDPTVVSVVTTTRTRELTSRAPRDVSSSPELSLENLTDPNLMNADLFLREPRSKSERKKKDASSLTSRRLTSRKFLRTRSTGIARPSRDTPTSTKKTRSV